MAKRRARRRVVDQSKWAAGVHAGYRHCRLYASEPLCAAPGERETTDERRTRDATHPASVTAPPVPSFALVCTPAFVTYPSLPVLPARIGRLGARHWVDMARLGLTQNQTQRFRCDAGYWGLLIGSPEPFWPLGSGTSCTCLLVR